MFRRVLRDVHEKSVDPLPVIGEVQVEDGFVVHDPVPEVQHAHEVLVELVPRARVVREGTVQRRNPEHAVVGATEQGHPKPEGQLRDHVVREYATALLRSSFRPVREIFKRPLLVSGATAHQSSRPNWRQS
jgi:hypothetical protein